MIIEIRTVFRTSRGVFVNYDEARKHKNREKDDMFSDGCEVMSTPLDRRRGA